jgi:hypothetical protein
MGFRISLHEKNVVERIVDELAERLRGGGDSPVGDAIILRNLQRVKEKLGRVLTNQARQEKRMATAQETIDRLVAEHAESRAEIGETLTSVQAAVALIQDFPNKVRTAVEEALRNNPGVDLSAVTAVADELDAQQGALDTAQQALDAAVAAAQAPTTTPEPIEPEPSPAPEPEVVREAPVGGSESGAI